MTGKGSIVCMLEFKHMLRVRLCLCLESADVEQIAVEAVIDSNWVLHCDSLPEGESLSLSPSGCGSLRWGVSHTGSPSLFSSILTVVTAPSYIDLITLTSFSLIPFVSDSSITLSGHSVKSFLQIHKCPVKRVIASKNQTSGHLGSWQIPETCVWKYLPVRLPELFRNG